MQEFVERRARIDRRDASRPAVPPGIERRRGERRHLPRARWRQWGSLGLSALLGVATAFVLQALRVEADGPRAAPPVEEAPAAVAVEPSISRVGLAEAQALRDAAEALTPAAVALEEDVRAGWLLRLGELESAATDPRVPPEVRDELHATLSALARVGIAARGA